WTHAAAVRPDARADRPAGPGDPPHRVLEGWRPGGDPGRGHPRGGRRHRRRPQRAGSSRRRDRSGWDAASPRAGWRAGAHPGAERRHPAAAWRAEMRRRSRGFTLMEVMIAAAVVALMGMTVAVAFQTSARARDIVVQDNILYRQIRISLTRMSRELGSAFVSDKYDPNRYRDQNDRPTNFIGQRDRITFTTFAHQRLYTDSKQSDQAVV